MCKFLTVIDNSLSVDKLDNLCMGYVFSLNVMSAIDYMAVKSIYLLHW